MVYSFPPWPKFELKFYLFLFLGTGFIETIFSNFVPSSVYTFLLMRSFELLWIIFTIHYFNLYLFIGMRLPSVSSFRFLMMSGLVCSTVILFTLLLTGRFENIIVSDASWLWHGILLTLVVGPFLEEMLFRAGLYTLLRQKMSIPVSIILSALVFSLLHGVSIASLGPFVGGLIFAYAYEVCRNIWVPILLHFGANAAIYVISAMNMKML